MRALTWRQPFAELMFHGKIETRKRPTHYRGEVLICAAKKMFNGYEITAISGQEQYERLVSMFGVKLVKWGTWQEGFAVGVGTLVDCRKMLPEDEDKCFVKYNPLLYCHIYENVRRIEPVPFKGAQGWTILNESFINQIKYIENEKVHF